ncbi:DNA polymerase [Corynebacterium silvaticum]|uniref:DNA polymerase n=1 Tax=Corynebacterium silvaticum TaxID=2320431 RepID=UPI001E40ADCB|nr:DNA polymerase [Corynebacterium silvaticum]
MPDLAEARGLVRIGDFGAVELLYDSVPDTLSQLIRTAFIPADGHRFVVADFSAIEARVIVWLAGETTTLQAFRDGKDLYCETASRMFGVPVDKDGVNSELRLSRRRRCLDSHGGRCGWGSLNPSFSRWSMRGGQLTPMLCSCGPTSMPPPSRRSAPASRPASGS